LICSSFAYAFAQQTAIIEGKVINAKNQAIELVTISILNSATGTATDKSGNFRLEVPATQDFTLVIKHIEYKEKRFQLNLKPNEVKSLTIQLGEKIIELEEVDIITNKEEEKTRDEAGTLYLKARTIRSNISAFGDFNQALVGQIGVVGNNELSSSYSVRGGNFDENLVYVNDIQVYRPFLVRSGQQEGLSFVNPELVEGVSFSAGGWQPKYGDKLSSSLNITYKTPSTTRASLIAGLLGGSAHLEGRTKNGKFTHATGIRYKDSRYLLGNTEIQGEYLPRFFDLQTFITVDLSGKSQEPRTTTLSFLGSYASNSYEVEPENQVTNFGTFQQALQFRVGFDGDESLKYNTWQGGLKLSHFFSDRFKTNLIVSGMNTQEREYIDLEKGYLLCDVDKNTSSATFNECVTTRGVGALFDYARNALDATIFTAESRNEFRASPNTNIEFGFRYNYQDVDDILDEYSFFDSVDFVTVTNNVVSENELVTNTLSGYFQSTHFLDSTKTLTYGLRATYFDLNGQLLLSPRVQFSLRPNWRRDIAFSFAAGVYQQPAFYRELRGFDGQLNRDLLAQGSLHLIAGMDYDFKMWGRPFKLLSEVYHKRLWDVVPYDIDNVRLRYYANNNAVAKVTGFDVRLSGEFIKDAESWINLSLLTAQEDVEEDGRDYIRRPSDQRMTFGMFFQDHFPGDPTWKMNIKFVFGTGLPYGPPNSFRFRQALQGGNQYNRMDIGFSKLLVLNSKNPGSKSLESLWIGLEVLNLLGVDNTIAFTWITDFSNNQYAVPNSLSQRFFNLRAVLRY
ncbi:MAG: TonB-dependent receptor, partial [Flammeovirgaceae bacterium]